ncbi:uncharacterized protein J4E87_008215 [Alternaria ethzedia]|uniref:uncharacterized protein n=1 Tax=Alternaria ethzedia TaxID=181014 RepID=UPI0020C1D825|nr:uncharacterized protein J4E87_008215 [Alternaria ethzedia]KAI4617579.1 hypothetical protein J4E87_008215 [Alternaria ethzedia]
MFTTDPTIAFFEEPSQVFEKEGTGDEPELAGGFAEESWTILGCDSGRGSSLKTTSEISDDKRERDSPSESQDTSSISPSNPPSTISDGTIARTSLKRRRSSSSASISNGAQPYPVISYASDLLSSSNNAYLTESLLRIYHDSFENALACWVTERTCPYSAKSDNLLATNAKPDWNRIYHRVVRLDRLASAIRGRKLTQTEDRAASRALDLAVFSFASQWAQSSPRSRTKYPFHSTSTDGGSSVFDSIEDECAPAGVNFDRTLQISAWHEARNALQKAGEVESFRVVLAQIIFALTQRPVEAEGAQDEQNALSKTELLATDACTEVPMEQTPMLSTDQDVDECADLMSKLDLAIESDGPPVHLESGLRLIHSLRSRMTMSREARYSNPGSGRSARQRRSPVVRLEDADRATVDLLFWVGVMFDTLSAAMHKRPLVVSDEDSDVVMSESMQIEHSAQQAATPSSTDDGLWDDYLFSRQQQNPEHAPTRWPCSFDEAAAALCDAAPVKVLLFRRVCRIQTLLTRNARGAKVEEAVSAAMDVCNHWDALYAPFVRDCIQNHDRLPPRVQSWYVCVTGHWHLATLLLADLMEVVDESELGLEEATHQRNISAFIAKFRENQCRVLSDLASCACPREDASFAQSEFHFAVNEGALLTEPWTVVLIRAFAKAGVLLLELWDTIKKHEESVPVAQLAEEHHRRHGRSLRIAVDEADWRFNNLTVQQVYTIRETSNEYAYQGIEKAMFYRICRLLTLNIQLIFVFDGPGRPWKRGKRGGARINYEEQRLLKEMLQYFGIPYHEAPGEAEAECARLQILGMVDAVWSQDSDSLMFGCTLWLRDHRVAKEKGTTDRSKENTKKNGKYASVVRAHDLKERYGLDREGLVLFAMLVGGDYDVKGLPQCGPSLALQAVKQGLGRRLCACRDQMECGMWTVELAMFLERSARGRAIEIPPAFPDFKILQKYYKPKVTSDADLLSKSRLNLDYVRPIQELKLLTLTSERFNIWGRLYMNWVGPVLLTRSLTARDPSLPQELVHGIRLTKQKAKKTDNEVTIRTFERKLTFSPFGVTTLSRADFEGERLGCWNGDKQTLFDPEHRVECEYPEYWLRKVLPPDVLEPPPAPPKRTPKRKRPIAEVGEDGEASGTAKRKRTNKGNDISATQATYSASPRKSRGPAAKAKFQDTQMTPTAQKIFDYIALSDSEDEDGLSLPANTRSQEPALNQPTTSHIIDLGSPEPSDQENDSSVSDPFRNPVANTLPFDIPDEEDEELQRQDPPNTKVFRFTFFKSWQI